MRKISGLFLLLSFVCSVHSSAQFFSSDDKLKDEIFLREIKVIDEFIERFNDDPSSFIRREYKKQNKPYDLSRKEILVSLFNLENAQWSTNSSLGEFFRDASDSVNPPHLSFADTNWYSEAKCTFLFNGKKIEIPLILQVQIAKNQGSKWMIAGVGDNLAFNGQAATVPGLSEYQPKLVNKFIATSSYATNFSELANTFADKKNILDYFTAELLATERGRKFVNMILQNKIEFKHASDIKFYFYQIPNWVFEVEEFDRKSLNSGWLINDIKKVQQSEKEVSRRKLLQR